MWIFIKEFGPGVDMSVVELFPPVWKYEEKMKADPEELYEPQRQFTFCSGNLLLGLEALGKFQKMADVRERVGKILDSLDLLDEVNI
jgi:hypothetical protein